MRKLARGALVGASALGLMLAPALAAPANASNAELQGTTRHAIVVCQSASFYKNYDSSTGPTGFIRTLYYGNKIGHTPGSHPVHNGWAAAQDFGPNDWGFLRIECIGGYDSW